MYSVEYTRVSDGPANEAIISHAFSSERRNSTHY